MRMRSQTTDALFVSLFMILAVASRLLPHEPGFVAVTGASMFAGWYLRRGWLAGCVPLAILLLSDLLLGFYQPLLMLAVYLAAVAPVMMGRWLRGKASPIRLAIGTLGCSVLSLLSINFMVWLTSAWYAKTAWGLLQCYLAALPFFKYRVAGDLVSVAVCFGLYAFVVQCGPFSAWLGRGRLAHASSVAARPRQAGGTA